MTNTRVEMDSSNIFLKALRKLQGKYGISDSRVCSLLRPGKKQSGRPTLQISIGAMTRAYYLRLDKKDLLRRLNRDYRILLEKTGVIEGSLKTLRNRYRKNRAWIPENEWAIITHALKSSTEDEFDPATLAAELVALSVRNPASQDAFGMTDSKYRAAIKTRLLNRKLFHQPKPR
ncbi:MAG: hypothetical protein AAB091_04395 [Elusimicrobiota bacterium]